MHKILWLMEKTRKTLGEFINLAHWGHLKVEQLLKEVQDDACRLVISKKGMLRRVAIAKINVISKDGQWVLCEKLVVSPTGEEEKVDRIPRVRVCEGEKPYTVTTMGLQMLRFFGDEYRLQADGSRTYIKMSKTFPGLSNERTVHYFIARLKTVVNTSKDHVVTDAGFERHFKWIRYDGGRKFHSHVVD